MCPRSNIDNLILSSPDFVWMISSSMSAKIDAGNNFNISGFGTECLQLLWMCILAVYLLISNLTGWVAVAIGGVYQDLDFLFCSLSTSHWTLAICHFLSSLFSIRLVLFIMDLQVHALLLRGIKIGVLVVVQSFFAVFSLPLPALVQQSWRGICTWIVFCVFQVSTVYNFVYLIYLFIFCRRQQLPWFNLSKDESMYDLQYVISFKVNLILYYKFLHTLVKVSFAGVLLRKKLKRRWELR